jgi:hypothetical protein
MRAAEMRELRYLVISPMGLLLPCEREEEAQAQAPSSSTRRK